MINIPTQPVEITEEMLRQLIENDTEKPARLALVDYEAMQKFYSNISDIEKALSKSPKSTDTMSNDIRKGLREIRSAKKGLFGKRAESRDNEGWSTVKIDISESQIISVVTDKTKIRGEALNLAIEEALERAEWIQSLFSSVDFATQKQACKLLGKSDSNPSATLRRLEEKRSILRFDKEGRPAYPLFQFDIDRQRVHPVISDLIKIAEENRWPEIQLLEWLVLDNDNFEGKPPFEFLGSEPDYVSKIFKTVSSPPDFG